MTLDNTSKATEHLPKALDTKLSAEVSNNHQDPQSTKLIEAMRSPVGKPIEAHGFPGSADLLNGLLAKEDKPEGGPTTELAQRRPRGEDALEYASIEDSLSKAYEIKDQKSFKQDLTKLLGPDRMSDIAAAKEFETDVTLKHGDSEIKLHALFRPKYNDLVLSPRSGSEVMTISLDSHGMPNKTETHYDKSNLFGQVFAQNGYNAFSGLLGENAVDQRLRAPGKALPEIDVAPRKPPVFENKEDPHTLNPNVTIDQAKKVISAERQETIDYKKMISKDSPVLFTGDSHLTFGIKDELIQHAKDLKAAGVTHFAIEMIPESMNKTLTKYYEGDSEARAEIQKYLKDVWHKSVPGVPEKIMAVLDAMKEQKIKPVGIDTPGHDGEILHRNQNWARVISDIVKHDPNARVAVFGGEGHLGYGEGEPSANEVLSEQYGIKSKVITFAGGMKPPPFEPYDLEGRVTTAAAQAGLNNRRFQIGINPTFSREADYMIHLPQTQNFD